MKEIIKAIDKYLNDNNISDDESKEIFVVTGILLKEFKKVL